VALSSTASVLALVEKLASLGVWQWHVAEDRVEWSDALYAIYGLPPDGFAASFEGYLDRVHPEDRAHVEAAVRAALESGERFAFEERIVRPSGEIRVLESAGEVVRDDAGRPLRMVGACMDVTDRRALQKELGVRERLAAIGTLAAGVAHELNNPLHYVLAAVDRIEGTEADVPLLADVTTGLERMRHIVRDLGAYARPAAPGSAPVCLAEIVRGAVSMAGHELRHRASLRLALDDDVHVDAAGGRLGQVVLNLLTNAAHALPVGHATEHEIRVSVSGTASQAELLVDDTGAGIPDGLEQRVFDPFFTTRPIGEGIGLGLFLTRRIVTALGGTISVTPRTDGGTRARVLLPRVASPERAADSEKPMEPRRRRVLLIDDDALVGRALRRMLRDHDTVYVSSAADALALLEDDRAFDLILCDLMMPEGMGHALHADVVARWPELDARMVFMTGGASTEAAAAFAARERARVLDKPFSRDRLLEILAR